MPPLTFLDSFLVKTFEIFEKFLIEDFTEFFIIKEFKSAIPATKIKLVGMDYSHGLNLQLCRILVENLRVRILFNLNSIETRFLGVYFKEKICSAGRLPNLPEARTKCRNN